MSTGLYSHTTRATGTVLTAAIYNADHVNHITNHNPVMMGGYSDSVSQMRLTTDPGSIGSESLSSNLAGELERLRFCIQRLAGTSEWYAEGGVAGMPPGVFSTRLLDHPGGDVDHDIIVKAGRARTDDDTADIVLPSDITKQIDAAWAVGTDQGGLDTGSVAPDSIYYIWLIQRSDTGVADALFSLSATAPTMPASYDRKQRIGWVRTDGSANIRRFTQNPNDLTELRFDVAVNDVSETGLGDDVEPYTLLLPPNSTALIRAAAARFDAALDVLIQSGEETPGNVNFSGAPGITLTAYGEGGLDAFDAEELEILLDSSSQFFASSSSDQFDVVLEIVVKGARLGGIIP